MKKTNELPPLKETKDTVAAPTKDNNNKESSTYLFRPVAESPDASPQRMRTRNKAAKEQTSNRVRPKRGGTETPEPKTPSKQTNGSPNTPSKKKATAGSKNEKVETPTKNRKRGQEKIEDAENDEKDLGLFKKKRERAESPSSVTTDSGSVNDEMENNEAETETVESSSPTNPAPSTTIVAATPEKPAISEVTTANVSTVPVITSTKIAASAEPMPLNVSIRLPDDLNERKNLIKRNLVEFNVDCTTEVKKEVVKLENVEKDVKEEVPEKFKTELIIPKVVAMEKPAIVKEEVNDVDGVKEEHINHYPLSTKEPSAYNYSSKDSNTVIKIEPRDESIELTSNRSDMYNVNPPLNIPTVIPTRNAETSYEDEKQREKLPERNDLAIGQPPLPNMIQSSNLVTIGGNQQHYSYLPYAVQEKPQNEPQNLKIKQEVVSDPPVVTTAAVPQTDPLQSLRDVKVPGFSLPAAVTQQTNEPTSASIENIKKEVDFGPVTTPRPVVTTSPAQPPVEKSPKTPVSSVAQTPPRNSPQPNHSAINLISPSASVPPPPPPQQTHPFNSPMHPPPPHSLMHHPFLAHAMHQFHSHPYSGYPFSYPYPYGPVPQPHAIPPPHQPPTKSTIDTVSSTMMSAQHTTSSSLTTKREIREPDENGTERHQTHEMTLTHQQSTSHHSTVHASSEKHNYGGGTNHSITISHSTSSSSSQSVQHKVNQKTVRTSSPHASITQTSTNASINHSSSTHTHHHTHHHERLSPSGQLLNLRHHAKMPQTNPHHLMIQPPSMGHHLGPPSMASSSLEQLRAHAAQAAANMQNQSVHHTPTSSPMPKPMVTAAPPQPPPPPPQQQPPPPEEIKVEPDAEPVVEEEPQNSPPGPPRGPSPEPRIEDTECHRSQSAM